MKIKLSILCVSLGLGACQAITDVGEQAVDALKTVNSTLSSVTGSTSTSSKTSTNNRTLDDKTTSTITSAVNKASAPKDAKELYTSAKPTIAKVLELIACEKDSQLKAYADESSVGMSTPISPVRQMSMHKSGCINVQRIDGIKKLTANSFIFRVLFVSPQSEETYLSRYIAIKQPSGEWLFKWSSLGY